MHHLKVAEFNSGTYKLSLILADTALVLGFVNNCDKLVVASFAMLFGVISLNISSSTVMTRVDTAAPASPKKDVKSSVAIEEAAIFTILLPTSTVESSLSKLSVSFRARDAFLLPSDDIFFRRILFTPENAVSVAEKYAENIISTISEMTLAYGLFMSIN